LPGLRCKRNFVPHHGIADWPVRTVRIELASLIACAVSLVAHQKRRSLLPQTSTHVDCTPCGCPPRLGEHGGAILREAGFSDREIEALIAEGAMVEADPA